jgi:opacity protein-like surface antigen
MKRILLTIAVIAFLTATSYAQEDVLRPNNSFGSGGSDYATQNATPWALGIEAGLSYNLYSADLAWVDGFTGLPTTTISVFNVFESLDGISPHIGAFADYDIDDIFGIHLKLLYNAVKYGDSESGIVDFVDTQNNDAFLGTGLATMEIENSYQFLNIEPHLRINATPELYFLIGPSFQLGLGSVETTTTYTENEDFVTYNAALPDEGSSSKTGTTSADFSDSRIALNIGAGYKFKISEDVFIAPQLILDFGLSKYDDMSIENTNQQISQDAKVLFITNQTVHQIRLSATLWFENLY